MWLTIDDERIFSKGQRSLCDCQRISRYSKSVQVGFQRAVCSVSHDCIRTWPDKHQHSFGGQHFNFCMAKFWSLFTISRHRCHKVKPDSTFIMRAPFYGMQGRKSIKNYFTKFSESLVLWWSYSMFSAFSFCDMAVTTVSLLIWIGKIDGIKKFEIEKRRGKKEDNT